MTADSWFFSRPLLVAHGKLVWQLSRAEARPRRRMFYARIEVGVDGKEPLRNRLLES